MKKLLFMTFILFMTFSCKQDKYSLYSGGEYIQFSSFDTMRTFTFYYSPEEEVELTTSYSVTVSGGTKSYDRKFRVEQVLLPEVDINGNPTVIDPETGENNGTLNAIEGTHYKSFADNDIIVPAGGTFAEVKVVMFRHNDLNTQLRTLKFKLHSSSDFEILGKSNNVTVRGVEFTNDLAKPTNWNDGTFNAYFGSWTKDRHAWLIRTFDYKYKFDYEMINNITNPMANMMYFHGEAKRLLALENVERASKGLPPVQEQRADGLYYDITLPY